MKWEGKRERIGKKRGEEMGKKTGETRKGERENSRQVLKQIDP